jgi:hypothetical protein
MGQIVAVLPAFLLACVAVAALPGPDGVQIDRVLQPGRERGRGLVSVIPGPVEPPVHPPLHPAPHRAEQGHRG